MADVEVDSFMCMGERLTADMLRVQLHMLERLHGLCERHSLVYWLCGGTLIGCLRHSGFIPHDDDVDVAMPRSSLLALQRLLDEEHDVEDDLQLRKCARGWKGHEMHQLWFHEGRLAIDVFVREEPLLPSDHFAGEDEVFPLVTAPFCGVQLKVPRRARAFVQRAYSVDVMHSVVVYNHDFNAEELECHDKRRCVLPLAAYCDALATWGYQQPTFSERFVVPEGFWSRHSEYKLQKMIRRNQAAAKFRRSKQRH